MKKLAPARVSYRDDFLISYRVYMMTGSFHISLFEGTLCYCERFEPRSHFKSRLSLIVRVNVVLNRTVVVDSD